MLSMTASIHDCFRNPVKMQYKTDFFKFNSIAYVKYLYLYVDKSTYYEKFNRTLFIVAVFHKRSKL
jgi:hypothetical protein